MHAQELGGACCPAMPGIGRFERILEGHLQSHRDRAKSRRYGPGRHAIGCRTSIIGRISDPSLKAFAVLEKQRLETGQTTQLEIRRSRYLSQPSINTCGSASSPWTSMQKSTPLLCIGSRMHMTSGARSGSGSRHWRFRSTPAAFPRKFPRQAPSGLTRGTM